MKELIKDISRAMIISLVSALLLSLLLGVKVQAEDVTNACTVSVYRDGVLADSGTSKCNAEFKVVEVNCTLSGYARKHYYMIIQEPTSDLEIIDKYGGSWSSISTVKENGITVGVFAVGEGYDCVYDDELYSTTCSRIDYIYDYGEYSSNMWREVAYAYINDELTYVSNPTSEYNSDIPTPQVVLDQYGRIGFNNKTDNYYIEMQGRWRTVEDIDIYSENLVWKYKYQSRIDSDLTTWISQDERIKATADDLALVPLGGDNFSALLLEHPSIERNIYTSNSLGEILSGFSGQKSLMINYLDNAFFFQINSPEIYVRYYTIDENDNVEYGRWCHAYVTMPTSGKMNTFRDDITEGFAYVSTQSDKGLTEDELSYVEDLEDTRLETDASISNNSDGSTYVPNSNLDTSQLMNTLQNMFSQAQAFFGLFSMVFSFLPEWLTNLIYSALGIMVLIGVVKFVRG